MSDTDPVEQSRPAAPYLERSKLWLQQFERCVRKRQYPTARLLFYPKVVWFGVESNICADLDQLIEKEFKQLWPNQLSFTIDLQKCAIIPGDPITIAAAWYAAGKIAGAPLKRGRITILLGLFERDKLRCLNGHQSLNPVPSIET